MLIMVQIKITLDLLYGTHVNMARHDDIDAEKAFVSDIESDCESHVDTRNMFELEFEDMLSHFEIEFACVIDNVSCYARTGLMARRGSVERRHAP